MGITHRGSELSLCWYCKNTNRFKCSWFNPVNPQPVPGWVAELRHVKGVKGDSYRVKECPNFDQVAPPPEQRPPHHIGVTPTKEGYWQARIYWRRRDYYLGHFKTEQDAIAARKAAEEAIKRGEEPCRNNRR